MDNETGVQLDVYWRLALERERVAQILDCPTFGERTPEIDRAWREFLGEQRRQAAFQLTLATKDSGSQSARYTRQAEDWEHWNRPSEIVRADHAHDPIFHLARNTDGLADLRFGRPGQGPAFNASDLIDAPRVIAVLDSRIHPDDMLDLDHDTLYQSIQRNRTAEQLLAFAERVHEAHVDLVGREAFDMLLARQMEDERRVKLFQFCKTQQAMDLLTENEHGYPLFDAVIMAASLVRWADFWGSRGIDLSVPSMPILPADK